VEAVGIDGTSRKGHDYITVAADPVGHDVTDVTPGRDSATVERFTRDFMDHDGVLEYVRLAACGMSLGFPEGRPRASAPCAVDRRQVPCGQACRRGRRQGREDGSPLQPAAQTDRVPMADRKSVV